METTISSILFWFIVFNLICIPYFAFYKERKNRNNVTKEKVSKLIRQGLDQPKDIAKYFNVSETWLVHWMISRGYRIKTVKGIF